MEQTRAINALAPFLALSKSASSGRAAADLVTQATSAPNTYVFGELLQTPAIQNLRNDSQYSTHYTLLELFAWGTWAEYQASASSLPTLTPAQEHKLRLLTILTLAANTSAQAPLTYTHLQDALSLSSPLALERLVTSAIYGNLVTGSLNPAQGLVSITSVSPLRDLAPGSVATMSKELGDWSQRCEHVLADLEKQMKELREEAARKQKDETERQDQIRRAEIEARNNGDVDEGDKMEVDDVGAKGGLGTKRGNRTNMNLRKR